MTQGFRWQEGQRDSKDPGHSWRVWTAGAKRKSFKEVKRTGRHLDGGEINEQPGSPRNFITTAEQK